MKNQKLSIYLIKGDITKHSDIVKDIRTKEEFSRGILYYKKSASTSPSWTTNFFNQNIKELKNSSASGLYITKIRYKSKDVYFGISFGHGWQMFKSGVIVEQFGIKVALGLIKDEIKKIEKKNFKNGLKDVSEQLGKIGSVADFGFDVEQDIMRAIVGEPENQSMYGKNMVGKDAVSFSAKKNVDEINDLLMALYESYISNKYKERFDWFDKFASVNDATIISELNNILIEKINNDANTKAIYWLAIPEVISWEHTKCFRYGSRRNSQEYQDITFDDFRDSLRAEERQNITIEKLKKREVIQVDANDEKIESWQIYKCMYAEIDLNNEKYLLVSGKYYKVDKDYKKILEEGFAVDTSFALPDWRKTDHENDYNVRVAANDGSYQCFDGGVNQRNLIGKGKIEFADLVKSDKHLVHVKKYGASAVLSHLFSQGLVSATLLLTDKAFREEVSKKLIHSHINVVQVDDPRPEEYTIVYAIGTNVSNLKLPFFSLVNYRNTKRTLELYKFRVLLIRINQN